MLIATVTEEILPATFAMLKDALMQVKNFTAWNALPKTTNIYLTSP
jgi:hypothetical protein